MKPTEFSKEEILYTYRKVKQELFYEKESISINRIVEFEEKLESNIEDIFESLEDFDDNFFLLADSIGKYNFIYKSIKTSQQNENFNIKRNVENLQRNLFEIESVDCRFMADISIVFQIIGGIWMNRIGYKIDEKLPNSIYGCRMKPFNDKLKGNVPYYKQNHSFYKPYFTDYKRWQNNLFKVISDNSDKNIQVITADITKYYHNIHLNTLKDKVDSFIEDNDIELNDSDDFIHNLLFDMLKGYNSKNNKYYSYFKENELEESEYGLPLTLNVSRILSNIYLLDFDKDLIENVKPLYYGRYVDDLIIGINYKEHDHDELNKILKDLKSHQLSVNNNKERIYKLSSKRIDSFELSFNIDKLKMFLLNGKKDSVEINHLIKSINEASSEWKLLPTNEDYEDLEKIDLFYKINNECESVNSIRKSSNLILKRNKFIREIISFESYIYNSADTTWKKRLDNFLTITKNYIFDLKNFIDLNKFIPRLFGLLVHVKNEKLIEEYFFELDSVIETFRRTTNNSNKKAIEKACQFLKDKIKENIFYSSNLNVISKKIILDFIQIDENNFLKKVKQYFNCDYHIEPFKNTYFKYDEYEKYLIPNVNDKDELKKIFINNEIVSFIAKNLKSDNCDNDCDTCTESCKKIFDSTGFYFFTRRATILDLSVAFKNCILNENNLFLKLAKYYYHNIDSDLLKISKDDDAHKKKWKKTDNKIIEVKIKGEDNNLNPIVCNTHLITRDESFDAKIRNYTEPDKRRKDRILTMLNNIIRCKTKIDYVLFHELSLPRDLYLIIAQKLAFSKINMIAGLEYKIDKSNRLDVTCDNQMVYILNLDAEFSGSVALYQSKLIGAVGESHEIFKRANCRIQPKFIEKLIIDHNNFIFTGLICNDMLDINNRSYLRGEIDNLFLIAWNKDLETYHHLVNSASLDIHSFITLTNNKIYGNSRIRAPYKNDFERDVQIIHGGELDNFMVSTLDVKALRNHQSNHIAPEKPFKPLPTGFKISENRKKK